MAPAFLHRLRKWRRRHGRPLAWQFLFAFAAGAALVGLMDAFGEREQTDAPRLEMPGAGLPAPLPEKLPARMEAAVHEELRARPAADLSSLPGFEAPAPLRSVDGTSFHRGDDIIRIDGVVGPTASDICRDGMAPWTCGLQARAALHNLVAGRSLFCRPRRMLGDGAMAADCELKARDAAPAGDVARLLVGQGWARPLAGREADFAAELAQARAAGIGLWRGGWTMAAP